MASRWLPLILALEIESAGWQANSSVGDTQAYPRDEHCQSAVGSAADPWRTPEARRRYRTDQRGQVHGQATRPAIPRLEDVPSQSRRRHRRDGSVRRADNLVSPALWIADHGARPATYSVVWRHGASNRRMDCKSGHGSMRMGAASPLSDPRSRWSVWRSFHPTTPINRHSRPTYVAAFPMAKRMCRTADRFD